MLIFDLFQHTSLKQKPVQTELGYVIPEEVQFSEELFDHYKSAREPYARKAKEWDDFRRGFQLTKEEIAELKRRRQPPLILNVIEPAVEQAKAMLTTKKSRFKSVLKIIIRSLNFSTLL